MPMNNTNKIIVWAGIIFMILNILIGLIVSAIGAFNIITTSVVIILTTIMLVWINGSSGMKEGFKVSLDFIIPIIGIIEYLFALFMADRFADNWCMILILTLLSLEILILLAAKYVSNKI